MNIILGQSNHSDTVLSLDIEKAGSILISGGPGTCKTALLKKMIFSSRNIEQSKIILYDSMSCREYQPLSEEKIIDRLCETSDYVEKSVFECLFLMNERKRQLENGELTLQDLTPLFIFVDEASYTVHQAPSESVRTILKLIIEEGMSVKIYTIVAEQYPKEGFRRLFQTEILLGQLPQVLVTNENEEEFDLEL